MKAVTTLKANHFQGLQKNLKFLFLLIAFQGHATKLPHSISVSVNIQYDSIYQWEFIDATQLWSLDTRIIDMHYNSNKELVSCITQYRENNTWINRFKETYIYDGTNHKTNYFLYRWDDVNWVDDERITYTYTGNDLATSHSEKWEANFNAWLQMEKVIYTYDSNGREYTREEQQWDDTWKTVRRYTTTYTSSNKIKKILFAENYTGHWIDSYQDIYTYDVNDNMIELLSQYYYNDWTNFIRISCIYNNNHRRILYVSDEWDVNKLEWVNPLVHSSYKWATNGNLLHYKLGPENDLSQNKHFSAIYNAANQLTDKTRHIGENENSEYTYKTDSTHYFIHEKPNGIADTKEMKNNLLIYPNPSNGIFTIQLTDNNPVKTIDLYNVTGACILHQASSNNVSIPDVQPGIYFVKINDGVHFYAEKIIIQGVEKTD